MHSNMKCQIQVSDPSVPRCHTRVKHKNCMFWGICCCYYCTVHHVTVFEMTFITADVCRESEGVFWEHVH